MIEVKSQEDDRAEIKDCSSGRSMGSMIFLNVFGVELSTFFCPRYPHVAKDHLVRLLKQLMLTVAPPLHSKIGVKAPSASDVPTLLGTGSFSLVDCM